MLLQNLALKKGKEAAGHNVSQMVISVMRHLLTFYKDSIIDKTWELFRSK